MDFSTLTGILAVVLGIAQPPPQPPSNFVEQLLGELSVANNPWGNCHLTEVMQETLGISDADEEWSSTDFIDFRQRWPDLYGATPAPAGPRRMSGDFAPKQTLLLAYQYYREYDEVFGEVISFAADQGHVRILTSRAELPRLMALLRRYQVSAQSIQIDTEVSFDTVWVRDWGPEPVSGPRGLSFIDGRYFLNCFSDDAAPTRLAQELGVGEIYRPDFWIEGGNLLANGAGLCFTTVHTIVQNGNDEQYVTRTLRDFYGCERTIFLESLQGNVVRHVDMFMYLASEDLVLLGQGDLALDPLNYEILEENARLLASTRTLEGQPLTILRVPMPPPRPAAEEDSNQQLIRSYLNMLAFNDIVLVPVFDDTREEEREALEIIQRAFSQRSIVPISVDLMAEDNGTIHCFTRTFP